ncbi:carbohydrate ABC transporter permease [Bacillus sp. SD088]|uniref:carbohydrate ABC transporter permease n=1 Tax=Bacillus sp. SD088 TaxID=2782012 RepID=UPI001A96A8DF|nr:carbohydrate ABC transporter permease [Bacillus sp. SD088]MBO0994348.1 carbohydrate ABC transporter permease [Bacillus sp. SD088]
MAGVKKNKKVQLRYVIAFALLGIMVFPYLYMVLMSFADWSQVDRKLIPTSFTLRSYEWLFIGGEANIPQPWLRAFFNTFVVSAASTALMMISGIVVAYTLAKIKFRGGKFLNNVILFQMFFPGVILLVPMFLLVQNVGLYDTYWAMIIPKALSLWAVFMYTNFFRAIPETFIESAKLDGASTLQIMFKIAVPMSKSITTVIFLFLFMERWTELLWDMIVVRSDQMLTLNVLISQMFGPYGGYPGPMYAASVLLTLPIIIIFLLFAKRFKDGMQFTLK